MASKENTTGQDLSDPRLGQAQQPAGARAANPFGPIASPASSKGVFKPGNAPGGSGAAAKPANTAFNFSSLSLGGSGGTPKPGSTGFHFGNTSFGGTAGTTPAAPAGNVGLNFGQQPLAAAGGTTAARIAAKQQGLQFGAMANKPAPSQGIFNKQSPTPFGFHSAGISSTSAEREVDLTSKQNDDPKTDLDLKPDNRVTVAFDTKSSSPDTDSKPTQSSGGVERKLSSVQASHVVLNELNLGPAGNLGKQALSDTKQPQILQSARHAEESTPEITPSSAHGNETKVQFGKPNFTSGITKIAKPVEPLNATSTKATGSEKTAQTSHELSSTNKPTASEPPSASKRNAGSHLSWVDHFRRDMATYVKYAKDIEQQHADLGNAVGLADELTHLLGTSVQLQNEIATQLMKIGQAGGTLDDLLLLTQDKIEEQRRKHTGIPKDEITAQLSNLTNKVETLASTIKTIESNLQTKATRCALDNTIEEKILRSTFLNAYRLEELNKSRLILQARVDKEMRRMQREDRRL